MNNHISNLTKEDYFSKFQNNYPDDIEIERTIKLFKLLILKMEKN